MSLTEMLIKPKIKCWIVREMTETNFIEQLPSEGNSCSAVQELSSHLWNQEV
jgi:hypothetical protein